MKMSMSSYKSIQVAVCMLDIILLVSPTLRSYVTALISITINNVVTILSGTEHYNALKEEKHTIG